MTTEEIAMHLAQEFGATKANKESAIYRACIRMAEVQKDICIDKACDEFKNAITMLGVEYDIPNVIKDKYRSNFRRTMEEYI